MRKWRHAVVVAGLGVAAVGATTTVLAQRQFQFFAHFADATGKAIPGVTETQISVQEDGASGKVLKLEPIDWPMKVALLIDNGTAGRFVEGLIESSARFDKELADKERARFFPVIVIVGSLTAEGSAIRDRDVQRLFQQLATHAMTTHVVMVGPTNQSGTTNVSNAIQIGISAAKQTGGRYESIAATTRLQTLLPEIGGQIDEADQRQRAQYRVTFERPEGKSGPQVGGIGLSSDRPMTVKLSLDGHMP